MKHKFFYESKTRPLDWVKMTILNDMFDFGDAFAKNKVLNKCLLESWLYTGRHFSLLNHWDRPAYKVKHALHNTGRVKPVDREWYLTFYLHDDGNVTVERLVPMLVSDSLSGYVYNPQYSDAQIVDRLPDSVMKSADHIRMPVTPYEDPTNMTKVNHKLKEHAQNWFEEDQTALFGSEPRMLFNDPDPSLR